MTELVATVGSTFTFIRKAGVSVRGTVDEITPVAYKITDTNGHVRTVNKNSVRKILS